MTVLTLHLIVVQVSGRYSNYAFQLPDCIIGLNCYLLKESGTKLILREKWRPAGTDFKGSNFRDFSVPPGHMACMRRRPYK